MIYRIKLFQLKYFIVPFILLLWLPFKLYAQHNDASKALQVIAQSMEKYRQYSTICFSIVNKLKAEAAPDKLLDSLTCEIKINGSRYYYRYNNTEFVNTGNYQMRIFSEEKIMQLAKISEGKQIPAPGVSGIGGQPVQMLDTLYKMKKISLTFEENDLNYIVTVNSLGIDSWKTGQYFINKRNGFFDKTILITRMDEMYGVDFQGKEISEGYAILESYFSDYNFQPYDGEQLREQRYFVRSGEQFVPSEQYKDFNIVIL